MKPAPLVLIHGFPLDHRMWGEVRKNLRDEITVLTPDLPGFGKVEVLPGRGSMDAYAKHLYDYLDKMGVDRMAMAGTSMGGYVALAFAERYPERVHGLALVDSQSRGDTPEAISKRRDQIETIRHGELDKFLSPLLPKLFSPGATEFHAYARECTQNAGPDGLIFALEAMAYRPDRSEFLTKTFQGSVKFIHATNDQIIPIDQAKSLAQTMTGSRWTEVSGGHSSPLESPMEVAQALSEWIPQAAPSGKIISDTKQYRPGLVWGPTDKGL